MDRISKELAHFRHELDEQFTTVTQRMEAVEKSLADVQHTLHDFLDKLEVEFRFLDADRDQNEKRMAQVEARIEALEKRSPAV